jgi:hypothetical protein
MSNALTVIQPNTSLVPADQINQGGLGLDFGSKLFQLKPATININQPNSQGEGLLKGHLRISETGEQYQEMFVALLRMPTETRNYYEGEPGQLNRTQDNLMCFSRDLIRPDLKAKAPQSMLCANCQQANWDKYRDNPIKDNIPKCDASYYALMIDTKFKMPLQMYIRSKSKKPFEAGMQNLSRTFAMAKSQGVNPNIFDIGFKLSTSQIITGKLPSYVIKLSDFRYLSPEERAEFGEIYLQYADKSKRFEQSQLEESAADQIDQAAQTVNSQVTGDILDGEIVI